MEFSEVRIESEEVLEIKVKCQMELLPSVRYWDNEDH